MPDFGSFRGFSEKLAQGQTPTQLGNAGGIIFGFDPDAELFFARVTSAGGTLSATEKLAVSNLFKDLKTYSLFTNMKALYPFVGASSNSCALNMMSNTFTGTFSGGITFSSLGISGNGANAKMEGLCNDFTSRNAYSAGIYINNNGTIAGIDMAAPAGFTIAPNFSSTIGLNRCEGNDETTRFGSVVGFYCNVRPNSISAKYYRNGTIYNTISGTTTVASGNFKLFTYSGTDFFTANRIALAYSYNGILSDTNVSNLYTAVQAFQTTLGRQV